MPANLEVTDLMLMQLADGELDGEIAERIRAALADDPDMHARYARFAATRAATQQAFNAVLQAPVPASLVQSVLATDMATAPPARRSKPSMPGWLAWLRAPNASAYAGWAVAGVALAVLALPSNPPPDITLGPARAALASVLESQPSGQVVRQGGLGLVALATHPSQGTHCRDFAADRGDGQTLGVACRQPDGWRVVAAVNVPGGRDVRPASADDPLLAALLERMDAGAPLSAEAEAALLRRGWR